MPPSEVMTNVPTEIALQQAQIAATRALTDSVKSLDHRMGEFGADLKDVRERLIELEAGKFEARLAETRTELREQIKATMTYHESLEARVRAVEVAIGKFTLALAVAGAVGGAALGVIATKVFGG
ncbi:hypothetical protein Kuura_006 [Caulobacter phage Kuura]|nr:hypothetical protein Kuura_006 [Caulobacter phage Kuura]